MQTTILDRLLAIAALFQRDMQRAFAGTSLTESRVHALWVLVHGEPMTQHAIAQQMQTTPRNVSALVDSLVASGYVTRSVHPRDRRAVLVELTEAAREMMLRMQADHVELSSTLLESVREEDRPAFERGIEAVLGRLDELVASASVHYAATEYGSQSESEESRQR